jgi:hypothetical protein
MDLEVERNSFRGARRGAPNLLGEAMAEEDKLREELVALIRASARAITQGLIEQAQKGGPMAAKFLFEFAGLWPPPPAGGEGEPSLVRLLFERLDGELPGSREAVG